MWTSERDERVPVAGHFEDEQQQEKKKKKEKKQQHEQVVVKCLTARLEQDEEECKSHLMSTSTSPVAVAVAAPSTDRKCVKFRPPTITDEQQQQQIPEFSHFCSKSEQHTQDKSQESSKKIKINHREFKRKEQEFTKQQGMSNLIHFKPASICNSLLNLFIFNTLFSHLINISTLSNNQTTVLSRLIAPTRILLAEAIECAQDNDCGFKDKICHENKCICARERPIEDQDRCLSLALLNEQCLVNEQCLGNSLCVEGVCSCGSEAISVFNPSSKIYYCHPKRRLNEECNYDPQCPPNSYCSMNKLGCLCQNGFASALVSQMGVESLECLPKTCSNSSSCESEFHQCDDNKCKCLATHFDPTTAKCYKFGSKGGKLLTDNEDSSTGGNLTATKILSDDSNFYLNLKDLTENSDKMWLVLIILLSLSLILLLLVFLLLRKHYLGFCWTAHKKEYEPNTKNPTKNAYFNKNSINNKSFRQKTNDIDEEAGSINAGLANGQNDDDNDDDGDASGTSSARANLVTNTDKQTNQATTDGYNKNRQTSAPLLTSGADKNRDYVKVNINNEAVDSKKEKNLSLSHHQYNHADNNSKQQYYQHKIISPLKSSTSTPV